MEGKEQHMPSQTGTPGPLAPRPLGSTGLQVTPICIGTAPLGNMPETFAYSVGEERALATIRAFFTGQGNSGTSSFNFLDTAASYGDGESERRIGLVLRELGGVPPGFVLATKADRDLQTGVFTGAQMQRSVERSLRLLGLEQLQLVYLHDPEHISFAEAMQPGGPAEALQFSLRDVRVTSTIVGITRPERLAETVKLVQHPIPDVLWAELDSIYRS